MQETVNLSVKLITFAFSVSFLVACLVACLRKYRYKRFQRRKGKAGNTTEEPTLGIAGVKPVEFCHLFVMFWLIKNPILFVFVRLKKSIRNTNLCEIRNK